MPRLFCLFVLLLALLAPGCGHKSGRRVLSGSCVQPNLVVHTDWRHSATVYVDGAKIGTVDKDDRAEFCLTPGRHEIRYRLGHDLNPHRDAGTFTFSDDMTPIQIYAW